MNPLQPSYLQAIPPAFAEHVIKNGFAVLWCRALSRWVAFQEAWFLGRTSSSKKSFSAQQLDAIAHVAECIVLPVVELPDAVQEVHICDVC